MEHFRGRGKKHKDLLNVRIKLGLKTYQHKTHGGHSSAARISHDGLGLGRKRRSASVCWVSAVFQCREADDVLSGLNCFTQGGGQGPASGMRCLTVSVQASLTPRQTWNASRRSEMCSKPTRSALALHRRVRAAGPGVGGTTETPPNPGYIQIRGQMCAGNAEPRNATSTQKFFLGTFSVFAHMHLKTMHILWWLREGFY